jgi:3D (Asp-Asp-Asp) domain-containing protein
MRNVARVGVFLFLIALGAGSAFVGSKVEAVTNLAKDSQESIQIYNNLESNNIEKFDFDVEVKEENAAEAESGARKFRATAYCLRGKTASGRHVRRGMVAADPRVLRLGTRIHLTGGRYTGNYVVADTGGKIKGRVLDIWVPSCAEARRWGRRSVSVKVLSKKKRK